MKICCICKVEKPYSEFHKNSKRYDKVQTFCKECGKVQRRERRLNNIEKETDRRKQYYCNHKIETLAQTRKYQLAKKNRVPAWADLEKIKAYYDVCSFFNEVNGYVKYHVDHKIPLQGKNVSGLHVHNNLQIISAEENLKKGNRYNG